MDTLEENKRRKIDETDSEPHVTIATSESKPISSRKITIHAYLYFDGNASEAVDYYSKIFEATVPMKKTFKEGPPCSPEWETKIMHAMLTFGENILMISDLGQEQVEPYIPGNNVQLSISTEDEAHAGCVLFTPIEDKQSLTLSLFYSEIFTKLSEDGEVKVPLKKQFWGSTFGIVKDKYKITWLLNCEGK